MKCCPIHLNQQPCTKELIKNNMHIKSQYFIKCPLCRKINKISYKQSKVSIIDEKCCVCMEREIEIFLPDCKHTNICFLCMKKLDQTI